MHTIKQARIASALAVAWLLDAGLAASVSAAALNLPAGSLAATRSGNDLVLSFPTITPGFYTVQTSLGVGQSWHNSPSGVPGDGTVKSVTITNGILGEQGCYRLAIQTPTKLLLSQSLALANLGYWSGGIREEAYVTGLDLTNGYHP